MKAHEKRGPSALVSNEVRASESRGSSGKAPRAKRFKEDRNVAFSRGLRHIEENGDELSHHQEIIGAKKQVARSVGLMAIGRINADAENSSRGRPCAREAGDADTRTFTG